MMILFSPPPPLKSAFYFCSEPQCSAWSVEEKSKLLSSLVAILLFTVYIYLRNLSPINTWAISQGLGFRP